MSCTGTTLAGARQPAAVFCNGIGDHLLTLPALRAVAHLFAGRLSLACLPCAREIFFPDLPVRSSHQLSVNGMENGVISFDAADLATRLAGCDLLICLNRALSDSVLCLLRLLMPQNSIGLFPAFSCPVSFRSGLHAADLAFDIPRLIDPSLQIDDFAAPPPLPEIWKQKAAAIRSLMPPGSRVLAVHAETAPPKMWRPNRFRSLLSEFLSAHPEYYALALGEREPGFLQPGKLARVFSCAGVPLQLSFAIVAVADCFLGIDSCLLHAADLFRVPAVGLFGPSCADEFGFRFSPGLTIRGTGSMESIETRDVRDALEDRCRL